MGKRAKNHDGQGRGRNETGATRTKKKGRRTFQRNNEKKGGQTKEDKQAL